MSSLAAYDPVLGSRELGRMWDLKKGLQHLLCVLSTHAMGWELRVAGTAG